MDKKMKITPFEGSSVLRKFTIFFILMSLIPVGVLYYLYAEVKERGKLDITAADLNLTLIFTMLGVLIGYFAIRSLLTSITGIARSKENALKEVLGPDKFQELVAGEHNEITVLAKSFNEITSRLEANIKSLEIAKKTLHSVLSRVGEGISSMQNIDNFLNLIVETVTDALQANVGALMLFDEQKNELLVKSVYGANPGAREIRLKADECAAGITIKTQKPLMIPKLASQNTTSSKYGFLFEEPLLCAPLILHDKTLGVISVSRKKDGGNFDEEELNLLYNLALQTAVAVENAKLNKDAEKTYFETISALALAVDAKDPYSRGHLDRVAKYAVQIAERFGLSVDEKNTLRDAARLHDLGKIGVTDEILSRPGPLDAEAWSLMKKHPEIGEGIIKPISSLRNLCDIIRHHHEMLDSSGYPDGLKGDEISLFARILSVADIFDAITTDRPYRKACTPNEAIAKLREMKTAIDQKVVGALQDFVNENRQVM